MRAHSTKAPQNVKIYYTFYPANRSEVQTIDWGHQLNIVENLQLIDDKCQYSVSLICTLV